MQSDADARLVHAQPMRYTGKKRIPRIGLGCLPFNCGYVTLIGFFAKRSIPSCALLKRRWLPNPIEGVACMLMARGMITATCFSIFLKSYPFLLFFFSAGAYRSLIKYISFTRVSKEIILLQINMALIFFHRILSGVLHKIKQFNSHKIQKKKFSKKSGK